MKYINRWTIALGSLFVCAANTVIASVVGASTMTETIYALNYLAIVAASVYEYATRRYGRRPNRLAAIKALLGTLVYIVVVLLANLIVGVNIGLMLGLAK